MIEMYAIAALALVAAGALAGMLLLFAVGIHKEERARSIDQANPGRSALGLRAVMSAHVHPIARQDLALPETGKRW